MTVFIIDIIFSLALVAATGPAQLCHTRHGGLASPALVPLLACWVLRRSRRGRTGVPADWVKSDGRGEDISIGVGDADIFEFKWEGVRPHPGTLESGEGEGEGVCIYDVPGPNRAILTLRLGAYH